MRAETKNSSRLLHTSLDLALSRAPHRVVTTDQLRRLGADRHEIDYRLKIGRLHRHHRGVHSVGHPELSLEGEALAAALAIGADAAAGHFVAGRLWSIWKGTSERDVIDVVVPRRVRSRPGIRVHSVRSLPAEDVEDLRGVPVTSALRTVFDLAAVMRSDRAVLRVVNQALIDELIEEAQLAHGPPRLRRLLGIGRTRSGLEDLVLGMLREDGLDPVPNAEVDGLEVDLYFPAADVVVEVDSDRYHSTPISRARDAEKQAQLELAGHRVMRVNEDQATSGRGSTLRRIRLAVLQPASGS